MPAESEIATQIRTALAKRLKRDVSTVHLEDKLREDLGVDSLAMLEMVFEAEEAFNIEIPDEDLAKITSVGDVVTCVEARRAAAAASGSASPAASQAAKKKATPRT